MKNKFKFFAYAGAILLVLLTATQHTTLETVASLFALVSGWGIHPTFLLGACAELNAFRTATESLDDDIDRSPRLDRAMYWRDLVPKGEFVKNQGVTRSTFTIKPTEPQDDASKWTAITLDGTTKQPTPACSTNYEDVAVDFFERTYGPKERLMRGPVICKNQLEFQHSIDDFIEGYVDEMGKYVARVFEFAFRSDIMAFTDWYVDHNKTVGPNAINTVARPYEDLTQDILEEVAADLINKGAGVRDGRGYVMDGKAGPIFQLYIDMQDSAQILRANTHIRDDARYASMGKDGEGDFGLWKRLGIGRVIGNFAHVPTQIAPRFNYTGGVLVPVSPFKDISTVGTDQVILTDAYINAGFHGAIVATPEIMKAEVVRPQSGGLSWEADSYNGEWQFITGGERICTPAEYDPQHHKGRHFGMIRYAPRPGRIHSGAVVVYKNCGTVTDRIFCS